MRAAPRTGCRRAGSRSISRRRATTSCRKREKDRVAQTLRLAERLGATAVTLPGRDIADDLLEYARANNITQIIIGKSRRSRWFELLHGSVVDALVRRSGNIGIQVLAAEALEPEAQERGGGAPTPPFRIEPYVVATILVALATAIGYAFDRQIDLPNISMIFIPVVLFSAIRHGLLPSLWATLLSTLAYNFFFLEPLYTLQHRAIRRTWSRSSSCCWSRSSPASSRRGRAPRPRRRGGRRPRPPRSTASAARSPASATWTTCCGRSRTRSP